MTENIMRSVIDNMGAANSLVNDAELYLTPRVDFYRKNGKLFVEAELPGIKPDDVDLHVYPDRLAFSAEKKSESREGQNSYIRSERYYGKVERVVAFPVEVNPDTAKATFKHGALTVEIAENVKPQEYKKISINSEE
jgi:HSP20 family protein